MSCCLGNRSFCPQEHLAVQDALQGWDDTRKSPVSYHMDHKDSPSERQAVTEELTTAPSNAQKPIPLKEMQSALFSAKSTGCFPF